MMSMDNSAGNVQHFWSKVVCCSLPTTTMAYEGFYKFFILTKTTSGLYLKKYEIKIDVVKILTHFKKNQFV